jgi:DNA-binding transcriptional ArsR family regulator
MPAFWRGTWAIAVDDLDGQLLHCLAVDGRASFSEIAAVLGVSDQTVARRYRRLRGAGVIRVVGVRARRSMRSLGWLLHLRCVPGSAQPLAEGLARRTDTAWVQLLSGDAEVLCTVRGAAAERDAVLARLPRGGTDRRGHRAPAAARLRGGDGRAGVPARTVAGPGGTAGPRSLAPPARTRRLGA